MQDWIAEKLSMLNRVDLAERALAVLKVDMEMGSPLLVAFADAHGGVPSSGLFEPNDYPEFQADMDEFLRDRSMRLIEDEIENLAFDLEVEGEAIHIWRAMVVPADWVDSGLHAGAVGICWAYDPLGAVSHDGGGGDDTFCDIKMHATVDFHDVDWDETIVLNAVDADTVGTEYEMRLKPEGHVRILSIIDQMTDEVLLEASLQPLLISVGGEGPLANVMSR